MSTFEEVDSPGHRLVTAIIFGLIALAGATDLLLDTAEHRSSPLHVALEIAVTLLSLGLAIQIYRQWQRAIGSLRETRESLVARQQERDEWQRRAEASLTGMRAAIESQLTEWELTPAEREVALMILQGKGHKQIASETHRSERTVRQHAVAVYEKSRLGGRAELAGFFLEGLMLPRE